MSLARESANRINNTQVIYMKEKIWPIGGEEKKQTKWLYQNQRPKNIKRSPSKSKRYGTYLKQISIKESKINNHGAPCIHHGPLCVRFIFRRGRIHLSRDARCSFFEWRLKNNKKKRHTYDLGTRESWKDQEEEERSWKEEADLFCFVLSFFLLLYNVYKWKGRCARKCVSTRTFPTKIKRIQKHKNKPKRIGIHFSITNIDWQRLDNLLHLPVLFYLFLFFSFPPLSNIIKPIRMFASTQPSVNRENTFVISTTHSRSFQNSWAMISNTERKRGEFNR